MPKEDIYRPPHAEREKVLQYLLLLLSCHQYFSILSDDINNNKSWTISIVALKWLQYCSIDITNIAIVAQYERTQLLPILLNIVKYYRESCAIFITALSWRQYCWPTLADPRISAIIIDTATTVLLMINIWWCGVLSDHSHDHHRFIWQPCPEHPHLWHNHWHRPL